MDPLTRMKRYTALVRSVDKIWRSTGSAVSGSLCKGGCDRVLLGLPVQHLQPAMDALGEDLYEAAVDARGGGWQLPLLLCLLVEIKYLSIFSCSHHMYKTLSCMVSMRCCRRNESALRIEAVKEAPRQSVKEGSTVFLKFAASYFCILAIKSGSEGALLTDPQAELALKVREVNARSGLYTNAYCIQSWNLQFLR